MTTPTDLPTFLAKLPLAQRAVVYARELHEGQQRDSDAAPFILHPLEVASLLRTTGHDEVVITAGLLHDTVENTDAQIGDIEPRFGPAVARLVAAMTEDPRIEPFAERKAALRDQIASYGAGATAVYAADKVAKVRELRAELSHDRVDPERAELRLSHYRESLAMLEAEAPSHPLVGQLRFELEALQALPPG